MFDSHDTLLEHMTSPEHCELIGVLNRSVPAVIRRIHLVSCPECGRQFRLNIALKLHMRTVHGHADFQLVDQPKFSCSHCHFWSFKARVLWMSEFVY